MTKYSAAVLLMLVCFTGCHPGQTRTWHVQERPYQPTDSVLIPHADWSTIQPIKIGDSLEDVVIKTKRTPVKYYLHPEYALLMSEHSGATWEIAFKYDKDNIIRDISRKRLQPR